MSPKQQELAEIVSCLGDGHDSIWNLFAQIAPTAQRFEILDWYHLVEHLHGVGGSIRRLENAEQFLWNGDVELAIALFEGCKFKRAVNFVGYLRKHCLRIPEYNGFVSCLVSHSYEYGLSHTLDILLLGIAYTRCSHFTSSSLISCV